MERQKYLDIMTQCQSEFKPENTFIWKRALVFPFPKGRINKQIQVKGRQISAQKIARSGEQSVAKGQEREGRREEKSMENRNMLKQSGLPLCFVSQRLFMLTGEILTDVYGGCRPNLILDLWTTGLTSYILNCRSNKKQTNMYPVHHSLNTQTGLSAYGS